MREEDGKGSVAEEEVFGSSEGMDETADDIPPDAKLGVTEGSVGVKAAGRLATDELSGGST